MKVEKEVRELSIPELLENPYVKNLVVQSLRTQLLHPFDDTIFKTLELALEPFVQHLASNPSK